MSQGLTSLVTGLAAGTLSGMFGIGGGIITTPAIRLLLDAPALTAVGTTLPVILPGSVVGAWSYLRRGGADLRVGVTAGLAGVLPAVVGGWATALVGGSVVLLGVAVLIAMAAVEVVVRPRPSSGVDSDADRDGNRAVGNGRVRALVIGAGTGLFSGFFGLGGGLVLVPMLTRWLHLPLKRAIGTSLVAISILAIPGGITHAVLGHVDWAIALGMMAGIVPGALVGARLNALAREGTVRLGFALLLVASALWLAVSEMVGLA